MPTHVIIDGYNLLGVRGRIGRGEAAMGEMAREQLLRDLTLYRQRKGHDITVVFDGWQQGFSGGHHEHRSGVEVIFSSRGERADQVIQRLAQEYRQDCAVVSSDHEVVNFAKAHGAFVISAQEFEARLRTGSPGPGSGRPASFQKDHDPDDMPTRRPDKKGNPRKLPKALRQRKRQLGGF
jgi:predicted RNA-binding protein with PIN domain